MRLYAGMTVESADGRCGELADVVIDPLTGHLTHLVVEDPDRADGPRFVPVDALSPGHDSRDSLRLAWTTARLEQAVPAGSRRSGDDRSAGQIRLLPWPYYPDGGHVPEAGRAGADGGADASGAELRLHDRVPVFAMYGEIRSSPDQMRVDDDETRRVCAVVSVEGHRVGHVHGIVVDPAYVVTHVVVDRGEFWGHREAVIETSAITALSSGGVQLNISRRAVAESPSESARGHSTQ